MLFYSFEFIYLFFPLTLIGYFSISKVNKRYALVWLVCCSLFFYAWWNPVYLILLLGSIFFNYYYGLLLRHKKQKKFLAIGIAVNLLLIAYYKYAGFLTSALNDISGTSYSLGNIILPLAISFFTFQQIAWLVDSYKDKVPINEKGLWEYILFVTFFPQLIAGPIVHHSEMMPQFYNEKNSNLNWDNIAAGLTIFSIGLAKKVIIADSIAPYANLVFGATGTAEIGFADAWIGATAYTLQLYFDFSGYADMAIGLARMFNIHLPLNFDSPYKAETISQFWRRWHMTLSRFLRDYVYIALGGNRKGEIRRLTNLMITMLLGGLWHGAGWTYIIWGGLHGGYLVFHHLWDKFSPLRLPIFVARITTFIVVVVAWVFFRAEDYSSAILLVQILFDIDFSAKSMQLIEVEANLLFIIIALIVVFFFPNTQELLGDNNQGIRIYNGSGLNGNQPMIQVLILRINIVLWKKTISWLLYTSSLILISLYFLLNEENIQEFIYFQF